MRLRLRSTTSSQRPSLTASLITAPTLLLAALSRAALAQVTQARSAHAEAERDLHLGGGGRIQVGSGGFGGSGYAGGAALRNILRNTHGSDLYTYPTDLTRGIVPKAIHSHNDYWRDVPFYSALSVGAVSVEADVWLINDTLYVGHELSALTTVRTFDALYVQPILDTLQRQNPQTPFITSPTRNGVFDTDSSQTLYLFIDLKTAGSSTLPTLLNALQPLRTPQNYLTIYNGSAILPGPITIILTGDAPADTIADTSPRDFFLDAPLSALYSPSSQASNTADGTLTGGVNITASLSPIASTDFNAAIGPVHGQGLNETQLALLRSQIAAAQARGVGARYWNTPSWPLGVRDAVWQTLWDEGVALVNVDDLLAGAGVWGGR